MVVNAPRCTRLRNASDGSAGVRGNEGPSLKPDLNLSKQVPSTRNPNVWCEDRSICSTK